MVFCFTGHTQIVDSYTINNEIVNWNSHGQLRKEIPRKTRKKKIEEEAETVGKTWWDPRRKMEEIYLALFRGGPVFRSVATGIYSIIPHRDNAQTCTRENSFILRK